jgi:hypothetical protein
VTRPSVTPRQPRPPPAPGARRCGRHERDANSHGEDGSQRLHRQFSRWPTAATLTVDAHAGSMRTRFHRRNRSARAGITWRWVELARRARAAPQAATTRARRPCPSSVRDISRRERSGPSSKRRSWRRPPAERSVRYRASANPHAAARGGADKRRSSRPRQLKPRSPVCASSDAAGRLEGRPRTAFPPGHMLLRWRSLTILLVALRCRAHLIQRRRHRQWIRTRSSTVETPFGRRPLLPGATTMRSTNAARTSRFCSMDSEGHAFCKLATSGG